ncbi:MAG: protein kinase [Chloroflexota bacterium]|nr:protein kinase [Chloroflexota bacterium]
MMPDEMLGRLLGHYQLLRSLGYGGSATVFLARDIHLQREVAIKVFMPGDGSTQDFLRRFELEARVLAQLDHPHILPVYEYGKQDGNAYLVMPHMVGGSLRDWLRGRGAVPPVDVVRLMSQMLSALQYAHERNLIHRDIKPGNMLFKADGTLMLADFGLVKILAGEDGKARFLNEPTSMTTHALTGTPDYMAPEQINGKVVPASDIYAMGVVLYEMLTGTHLFQADNYMGILMKQLYEQPRPLRDLNPQLSPELEAVVLRALQKDPARRYQRPDELRLALQQAIGQTTTLTDDAPFDPSSQQQQVMPASAPSLTTQPASSSLKSHTLPGTLAPPTPPSLPVSPQRRGASRSRTPLIVALALIILALVAGLSGVLYTQGLIGGRRAQATVGVTPVVSATIGGKDGPTPASVATTPLVPATQTSCPATGQARAAVTTSLLLTGQDNVVYIVNEGTPGHPTAGTIKRHEIMPGFTTKGVEISKLPQAYISSAQLSQDGTWVLFVANIAGLSQLRLVRVDGQGLQTLYCAPTEQTISHIQWSFDRRTIVFNTSPTGSNQNTTYLLDVPSGAIEQELASPSNLIPQVWLDNTHVYMVGSVDGSNAQNIYLLDIEKGAQQQATSLQKILTDTQHCGSFDTTYDSQQLLLSTCHLAAAGGGQPAPIGPTTVTSQSVLGGSVTTVQTLPDAVTMLRAIANDTLLLLVENASGDTSQNGLWRMNTDGTRLLQLSSDKNNTQSLCPFTQYAWSNVSRDGAYYALQEVDPRTNTYNMYYGSMSGGAPTQFAGITGTQLLLVGWTDQ